MYREALAAPTAWRGLLIAKKVEDIFTRTGTPLIEFRELTASTGDTDEFFGLNVEEFGPKSAGCAHLTLLEFGVAAAQAVVIGTWHRFVFCRNMGGSHHPVAPN